MSRTIYCLNVGLFLALLVGCEREASPINATQSELEAFRIQQEKDHAEAQASLASETNAKP